MSELYDVLIVGLGPAGATLARLLPREFRVLAIDKKSDTGDDGAFTKPCGGLLAPDAQKALSRFSLSLPKSVLVDPQIFAVRTLDTKTGILRHYQRFYMNMDRAAFDRWLISLVPARVERVQQASVMDIAREDGHFLVRYKTNGKVIEARARFLVGADGANSIVRRKLFPGMRLRSYVALQEWYQDENPRALYSCFFDVGITDCYAWSISKDGQLIIGGAFPKDHCKQRFEELKRKLLDHGYIFGQTVKRESCEVLRPRGFFDFCTGDSGAFLIGEAAGFISPSSLEGMSYAMESAQALGKALEAWEKNPNAHYNRRMRMLRLKLLTKNLKSLVLYTPTFRYLVMKSGFSGIELAGEENESARCAEYGIIPDEGGA